MTLKLRKLNGSDVFLLIEAFNKLDIIDELKEAFSGQLVTPDIVKQGEQAVSEIGINVFGTIAKKALANISKIKPELDQLISNLSGLDLQAVQEISLIDYLNAVKSMLTDEQITDFFGSLLSSKVN